MTSQKEATRAIAYLTEAIQDVAQATSDLTLASLFYMPANVAEPARAAHYRGEARKLLKRALHTIGDGFKGPTKAESKSLRDFGKGRKRAA